MKTFSKVIENENITESTDIHDFTLKPFSFLWKAVTEISTHNSEVKSITGFQFNDLEPNDYMIEYSDGVVETVNLEYKSAKVFKSVQEAYQYITH